MSLAWSQIPHVNSQDYVDVTRLEVFRRKHQKEIEALGGRLTFTVFALKAVAAALKAHPRINASLDTGIRRNYLEEVPPYRCGREHRRWARRPRGARRRQQELKELAVELNALVQRAHSRKIGLEEFQGGTLPSPTPARWGAGRSRDHQPSAGRDPGNGQGAASAGRRPGGKGLTIAARLIMPVVLCIDHRVLDGADAVSFLKMFKEIMEDPDELLMSLV